MRRQSDLKEQEVILTCSVKPTSMEIRSTRYGNSVFLINTNQTEAKCEMFCYISKRKKKYSCYEKFPKLTHEVKHELEKTWKGSSNHMEVTMSILVLVFAWGS